ncbi:hypothetical protein C7B67_02375 [filamentous cyanobacterium Phorm 6]|nr:hypothetical protein C7B67_02375 [filamentous cyanobacterium Phorm 6]
MADESGRFNRSLKNWAAGDRSRELVSVFGQGQSATVYYAFISLYQHKSDSQTFFAIEAVELSDRQNSAPTIFVVIVSKMFNFLNLLRTKLSEAIDFHSR